MLAKTLFNLVLYNDTYIIAVAQKLRQDIREYLGHNFLETIRILLNLLIRLLSTGNSAGVAGAYACLC